LVANFVVHSNRAIDRLGDATCLKRAVTGIQDNYPKIVLQDAEQFRQIGRGHDLRFTIVVFQHDSRGS